MVKRGGTKTAIAIKKITKKSSLRPICTKRREGLFSKASQLCLLSDSQIAILATPPSEESNVSFYSFGHSSVDGVISAFLSGQRPVPAQDKMRDDVGVCLTRKDLGLGFWWEDEGLDRSEDPQEVSDAMNSMWTLMSNLKKLRAEEAFVNNQAFVNDREDLKKNVKSDVVLHNETQKPDQTLNLQTTTSTICCVPDDIVVVDDDLPENFNEITEDQDQILADFEKYFATDNNNNNNNNALPEGNLDYDQEIMDIEELIDFDTPLELSVFDDWVTHQELEERTAGASLLTNSEDVHDHVLMETTNPDFLCSDSQGIEDGCLLLQNRCLDEDDQQFSDYFNDLATTIAAV